MVTEMEDHINKQNNDKAKIKVMTIKLPIFI